jgi:phosphatidylserine/phosphatidylglycerophosphate/cardiolipin synthase-like enzyme
MRSNFNISEIIDFIGNHPNGIILNDVLLRVHSCERDSLELQLLTLARDGHLRIIKRKGEYIIKTINAPLSSTTIKNSRSDEDISSVVVTVPTQLQKYGYRPGPGCMETRKAFEKLLSSSKRYVKMCLPFLEETAVSFFSEYIRLMAEKNIQIKLLTRNAVSADKTDYSHCSLLKGLLRIHDIYSAHGSINNLEFREHHVTMIDSYKTVHYESVHAKVIIVDGKECYIGSGEWRLNAMLYNYELGILASEKPTKIVEETFDRIWCMSSPVRYDYLTSRIKK